MGAVNCYALRSKPYLLYPISIVFVEQPYLPNGIDKEYLRWLYTAVTRAKVKLYLIGFTDDFFEE